MSARPVSPPSPPDGFAPMEVPGAFLNRSAHYFARQETACATTVGTWITPNQVNSEDFAHGGFLLTFADFAMSYILTGITINLSMDFLRLVPLGVRLETTKSARRKSKKIIFADAIATSNGTEALRMSGIFQPFVKQEKY